MHFSLITNDESNQEGQAQKKAAPAAVPVGCGRAEGQKPC